MKNLFLFDDFLNEKISKNKMDYFWDVVDRIANILKKTSNKKDFWILREEFPQLNKTMEDFRDKILVSLHNRNKVKKKTSLEERVIFFLYDWYEINNHYDFSINQNFLSFKDWFFNDTITVYRGIPDRHFEVPKMNISEGNFISTTMDIKVATKFTQYNWGRRTWRDEKQQNGWILSAEIKPCNVHIFSNISHEFECVIRGSFTFTKAIKVVEGELIIS